MSRWAPFAAARWVVAAVLGLPLLWVALAVSVAGVADRDQPAQALAWWPWSADAAADLGSQLVIGSSQADRQEAATLARHALARQAILPVAVRTLAIATAYRDPSGDVSNRLMSYGETLSRRDAPTQLGLIETNVQHGDVRGALVHYDRIMRTSPEARAFVLPVLTKAVNDPAIARALATLLARQPPWRDDFVSQLVTHVDNPSSIATLLVVAGLSPVSPQDRGLLQLGLTRIAAQGAPDIAYRLFRRLGGQAPAAGQMLVNSDLAREPGLAPFDWTVNDDPALATRRELDQGRWKFHASMAAGASGTIVQQMVLLHPGRYAIDAHVTGPGSDGSALTLTLRCVGGQMLFTAPFKGGDRIAGTASVQPGCRAAWLTLDGRGALDNGPSDYWIGPISMRALGPDANRASE